MDNKKINVITMRLPIDLFVRKSKVIFLIKKTRNFNVKKKKTVQVRFFYLVLLFKSFFSFFVSTDFEVFQTLGFTLKCKVIF